MAKAKKPPKLRRNRGALSALAARLLLSVFARFGEHAGQAFARDAAAQPVDAVDGLAEVAPPPPRDIQKVLDALQTRETRVAEAERQVRLRMAALEEAERAIEACLMDLREAEGALCETLALADKAADKDIERLVAVYENMKPKEAAALFETIQPSFAAGFLGRMHPLAAAGVMAGLTPDVAHAISVELAGRNAQVPTE
jgi:flagellar motility protein MotE (MotC chaperone)